MKSLDIPEYGGRRGSKSCAPDGRSRMRMIWYHPHLCGNNSQFKIHLGADKKYPLSLRSRSVKNADYSAISFSRIRSRMLFSLSASRSQVIVIAAGSALLEKLKDIVDCGTHLYAIILYGRMSSSSVFM